MNPSELYKLWAPENSVWSRWAKPVLFAEKTSSEESAPSNHWQSLNLPWAPSPDGGTAIVLDLPGAEGVWFGTALSRHGFRPVPLYNGVPGPILGFSLVNVGGIIHALHSVADALAGLQLRPDAPPVFLLDADRLRGGAFAGPGKFDNRWWTFPQDFPSANFLLSHGIRSVLLVQNVSSTPQKDLAHVLLRWQETGLQILVCGVNDQTRPSPILIARPYNFRALWYRALVLAGLRRNSTGGFGAIIPEPSSSGGFG